LPAQVYIHTEIYTLVGTSHISGTAEARVVKFYTRGLYHPSFRMTNHPQRDVVRVT